MLAKAFAEFDVLVLDIGKHAIRLPPLILSPVLILLLVEGTVCPITFVRDVLVSSSFRSPNPHESHVKMVSLYFLFAPIRRRLHRFEDVPTSVPLCLITHCISWSLNLVHLEPQSILLVSSFLTALYFHFHNIHSTYDMYFCT